MIQGLILKKVLQVVFKKIETKHKLNKLKKYVEEENELDKQMKQVHKVNAKQGKTIEELEKDVAILKADSHPPIFSQSDYDQLLKRIKKLESAK